MTTLQMEFILTQREIASQSAINLVARINGYTVQTMEDILYVQTGYRDFLDWLNDNPIA